MLGIFVSVVLPVFIVAGTGFLLAWRLRVPAAPLNQVALYLLLPAFVFTSLLSVDFSSETPVKIAAFVVLLTLAMIAVAFVVGRAARLDRATTSALMLAAAFPNLGNYGLSVVLLQYGREGVVFGSILLAVQSLYGIPLAIFIASSSSATPAAALGQVLRQPMTYAVAAALALDALHLGLPEFLRSALALPSQAAIPVMLLVLGMSFAGTRGIAEPGLVSVAVLMRLVAGAAVGWVLAASLGLVGVAGSVMVVGAAMPTAVFTILTATQFGARPRLVSDSVVASTLVSVVTVTIVLALLPRA